MDSNRLSYFLVVSEIGSIRGAAELLHLSPAALSKAIKQLEEEVGFALIAPSGRGILVTDQGKELALRAKPLLENLSALSKAVRDRFKDDLAHSPIKIGSFEVFTTHFLDQLIRHLPESANVLLREVIPGEMEKALLDREIDFGLTYIPIPTTGIEHQQVTNIEMGIFGTKELVQAIQDKPFEKVPFVIPIQPIFGSPNKVQGLDGWPDDRISRFIRYRVTLMESALEICRRGRAVAYLPKFVVHFHNETVNPLYQLRDFPNPRGLGHQKQGVFIARRKSDLEGEVFKKLARAIRMSCK